MACVRVYILCVQHKHDDSSIHCCMAVAHIVGEKNTWRKKEKTRAFRWDSRTGPEHFDGIAEQQQHREHQSAGNTFALLSASVIDMSFDRTGMEFLTHFSGEYWTLNSTHKNVCSVHGERKLYSTVPVSRCTVHRYFGFFNLHVPLLKMLNVYLNWTGKNNTYIYNDVGTRYPVPAVCMLCIYLCLPWVRALHGSRLWNVPRDWKL